MLIKPDKPPSQTTSYRPTEVFHDGLGETQKMVICWLGFPKAWLVFTKETIVFKMFSKTFFDDPFEKFHNCTK